MNTYRTIEEYRFDAESTFLNLEWRQMIASTDEKGCFIYKREWDRTHKTMEKLLENTEWARGIIRSMLQSPIPSEMEMAKEFISKIYFYSEFALIDVQFYSFFSDWNKFFSVLEGKQKMMGKPMKMEIIPDTKKVIEVDNDISMERKKMIWDTFKNKGFIDGDMDAFMQLCDGYTPKGTLKWLKTNTGRDNGSFSGVSLIHFLKKLGINLGEKNKNIRVAVCFFQNNENDQLTAEKCGSYLQNYENAKRNNEIIKEIDSLFSIIDK